MKGEIVRTAAGWHGRIRAANGEPIWTTEVLTERDHVVNAYDLLGELMYGMPTKSQPDPGGLVDVDERPPAVASAGDCPECEEGKHSNCTGAHLYDGEVIDGCVCNMRHHRTSAGEENP